MEVRLIGIHYPNEIKKGVDLWGSEVVAQSSRFGFKPSTKAILVVKLKAVSKSLGLWVDIATLYPTFLACYLSILIDKDSRFIKAVLRCTKRIVRANKSVLLVENLTGTISANAEIDRSNTSHNPNVVLNSSRRYRF